MKINRYWFKPKKYGYGAYPTTWEGWLSIAVFVALVFWRASARIMQPKALVGELVILTLALVALCYNRTDGKWKWRWGEK